MAVNPNLATLMRVIEGNQDKMTEGEYLEAMNALGALHRVATSAVAAVAVQPVAVQPVAVPPLAERAIGAIGAIGAIAVPVNLFASVQSLFRGHDDYELWSRVTRVLSHINPNSWLSMSQEEQNELNRESTRKIAKNQERVYRNPNPSCCPFVARHAVGDWRTNETDSWTCVCGYSGKIKHWQKHERSARHQEWAQHRIVPEKVVTTMQKQIQKDDQGTVMKCMRPLSSGGFRFYPVRQERNEWTHPELFPANTRRNDGQEWFVLQRHVREMIETHQNFNWGVDDRIEMFV
jgi:hypothetical protein